MRVFTFEEQVRIKKFRMWRDMAKSYPETYRVTMDKYPIYFREEQINPGEFEISWMLETRINQAWRPIGVIPKWNLS